MGQTGGSERALCGGGDAPRPDDHDEWGDKPWTASPPSPPPAPPRSVVAPPLPPPSPSPPPPPPSPPRAGGSRAAPARVAVHVVGAAPGMGRELIHAAVSCVGADRLRRVPCGAPEEDAPWIASQYETLAAAPQLSEAEQEWGAPVLCLRDPDTPAAHLRLPPVGLAAAALAQWSEFAAAEKGGAVPEHVRWQVSIPTPFGVATQLCDIDSREAVEAAYEAAVLRDVRTIARCVPLTRLCVQWEACVELGLLSGDLPIPHHLGGDAGLLAGVRERLGRLLRSVPEPAEVGLHLCCGDGGQIEVDDAAVLCRVAEDAVAAAAPRRVAFVHIPVPLHRDDDAWYAPLSALRLPAHTELYLGLIHCSDGAAGAARRAAAALRYAPRPFGVAAECGLGRRGGEALRSFLTVHREVAEALPSLAPPPDLQSFHFPPAP